MAWLSSNTPFFPSLATRSSNLSIGNPAQRSVNALPTGITVFSPQRIRSLNDPSNNLSLNSADGTVISTGQRWGPFNLALGQNGSVQLTLPPKMDR